MPDVEESTVSNNVLLFRKTHINEEQFFSYENELKDLNKLVSKVNSIPYQVNINRSSIHDSSNQ